MTTVNGMILFYLVRNEEDLDGLMSLIHPNGKYMIVGGPTAIGLEQVRALLAAWYDWFEHPRIYNLNVQPLPELRLEQPGAAECFIARYTLTGRYVRTIEGLTWTARAHGGSVQLPIQELVWLDSEGRIVRVDCNPQIGFLQQLSK